MLDSAVHIPARIYEVGVALKTSSAWSHPKCNCSIAEEGSAAFLTFQRDCDNHTLQNEALSALSLDFALTVVGVQLFDSSEPFTCVVRATILVLLFHPDGRIVSFDHMLFMVTQHQIPSQLFDYLCSFGCMSSCFRRPISFGIQLRMWSVMPPLAPGQSSAHFSWTHNASNVLM